MEPRYQSATERRELRRSIRNRLGTGRDDAPTAVQAVRAARDVARLVELATDGRYEVQILDRQGESTSWMGAINVAQGLTPGGTQREAG